mgnify:CR=1 FL=1
MKVRKPYIVRGFDVTAAPFTCLGKMQDLDTFTELVVNTQADAVVEMLTHSKIGTMSTRKNYDGDVSELTIIDFRFNTTLSSGDEFRKYRTSFQDVLKTWAEKSRVQGMRGWRANAIKTPTAEVENGSVVVRTQVILSNAVFYNDHRKSGSVNEDQAIEDLESLDEALTNFACGLEWIKEITYRHSIIGNGVMYQD